VQKGGDAHALPESAILVMLPEGGPFRIVCGKLQRAIQQLLQVYWLAYNLLGDCGLSGMKKVAAPNLDGRKAHCLRDVIHVPLHCEQALRSAKSTECAMGRSICSYGFGPNPHGRTKISSPRVY